MLTYDSTDDRLLVIIKSVKMPSRFGIYKIDFIHFSQQCIKHSMQYCLFTWKGNLKIGHSFWWRIQTAKRTTSTAGVQEMTIIMRMHYCWESDKKAWILTRAQSPIFGVALGESLKLAVIWLTSTLDLLSLRNVL